MKKLNDLVFPSTDQTISVKDDDTYGGAHEYEAQLCFGFNEGRTEYSQDTIKIPFVKKLDDGTIVPGLQSEQLAIILLDRAKKLNARFPSPQNFAMISGLEMFLQACRERVQDRIRRNVMGQLKR